MKIQLGATEPSIQRLMSMSDPIVEWIAVHHINVLIAVLIAALIVFLALAVKSFALRHMRKSGQSGWATILADAISRTRLWFLIALSARVVQGYARPPEQIAQTISFLFVVAAVIQAALWVRSLILGFVEHRATSGGDDDVNISSALGIIRLLVSFAVFAIATVLILDNLGVNVSGLVAGLGIGGIAIGLAAQGIFSDLFAALSIIFDKPFRVGDTITYSGKEGMVTGTVEEIGLKSTRIRSITGELRIIGNTNLLSQEVTNYAGRSLYRMHLAVGVIYQTDPDVAASIPDLMRHEVERAGHRFVRANFTGFGASSIDFELYFEADVGDIVVANTAYQDVALGILREFNRRNIEFAYPTQTTFTAAPDGRMVMPYPENALIPVRQENGAMARVGS